MILGLRRHAVRLECHDPAWIGCASREIDRITEATDLPRDRVQHVGSTSVPNLPAKPIVDIDIGLLETDDIEEIVSSLVDVGFIDRGHHEGGIGRLLVWEAAPEVRTVHIHIIPFGSVWWRHDLAFREALRHDPQLRRRYAALKADLASRHASDRTAYRDGKNDFIEAVVDRIVGSDEG